MVLKHALLGEIKLKVLKHAPLGEINLPFVASSANAPRCRRNRRYHTASALRGMLCAAQDDIIAVGFRFRDARKAPP